MEGWIKLHRKIQDHWLFQEKRRFSKFEAWLDLLMMANHEDAKVVMGNEIIEVKRGQRITSIRQLCDRWNWSNTKVIKFLKMLEEDGMATVKSDTKKTLITLDNYGFYQGDEQQKTTQKRRKNDTKTTQKHTNKNDKNEKNINIYSLFDHWNAKGIIKHKTLNKKMESNINARLKEYGVDELKKAIDNYAAILKGDQYYWTYKWTLQDFMKPNNVVRFLDSSDPFKVFFKSLKAVNGRQEYSGRYVPSAKETVFDLNAGEDWR